MNPPNPAVAIPAVMRSRDKDWLRGFRIKMLSADVPEIVAAIDARLDQLGDARLRTAIGKPLAGLTLKERVREGIRVYEESLAHKHGGKRVAATRTRMMVTRWGEREAVRRTVETHTMSAGLDLLAKHGRLDCAYEQIILDFPDQFDAPSKAKARENLTRLAGDRSPEGNMNFEKRKPNGS